ncbi:MAG: ABC transporter ATP-binding protein [Dehalococcoidia bacterium]|nr:ABC transporter ATP-binding protein [Dehalococcoidia bacterium]
MDEVLRVENLHTHFATREGVLKAVNGVSFALRRGKVLGIVGESGSGKSMTALSIMRLVPYPGRIVEGAIYLDGRNIAVLEAEELRRVRGRQISMIFQDPVGGLNPVIAIGTQMMELLSAHTRMSKRESRAAAIEILREVGLPDPETVMDRYPFQLSGGMCQRVMIGIATALNPSVLLADEPTSALDVTIQAQILDQLRRLTRERGTAIVLITHALGVVAQVADEVAVMYAGSVLEQAPVAQLFQRPNHPYTRALLNALPRLDRSSALQAIPGAPPNPIGLDEHCAFIPRCPKALTVCRSSARPPLEAVGTGHQCACCNPVAYGR